MELFGTLEGNLSRRDLSVCRFARLSSEFVCLIKLSSRNLVTIILLCVLAVAGTAQQSTTTPASKRPKPESNTPKATQTGKATSATQPNGQFGGIISGTVTDKSGALAVGAKITLTRDNPASTQELASGENGEYSFSNQAPGPFTLTVSSPGFETQTLSGELKPGEAYVAPAIALPFRTAVIEVQVTLSPVEVAQEELKEQEHQRVFGFIPNFYVTYNHEAAPLSSKQKFQLAFKSTADPVTALGVGFLAGLQQDSDDYGGYGQGAQGYAKRFGAGYANVAIGTFMTGAILPSLFKQDPRYYYKGTGTKKSRVAYALESSVMCYGDNKKWQVNYSQIIGVFATGGISMAYIPASDRSVGTYVQNTMTRIALGGVASLFQEFVLPRFTSHGKMAAREQQDTSNITNQQTPADGNSH